MSATINGVQLHEHVCEDCQQVKDCFEGRRVADGKAADFYRCPECDQRLVDGYNERMKAAGYDK